MAAIEVKVPDIGDFKDVPVIELLVKPGDAVKKEDSLVTLESDKATMEVPSPAAGVVKELKVKVGDKVSEGIVVLVLESSAAADAKPAAAPAAAAPAAGSAGTRCPRPPPRRRRHPPRAPSRFPPPPPAEAGARAATRAPACAASRASSA